MFFDVGQFEISRTLQEHWREIRAELGRLPNRRLAQVRHFDKDEHFERIRSDNGWTPTQSHPGWFTYILSCRDRFTDEAPRLLPRTVELLSKYETLQVGFSLLRPQTLVIPHTHPEYVGTDVLSAHLGLEAEPRNAYLTVEGGFEEEAPGKVIVFDGTRMHYAFNASPVSDRIILYLEFAQGRAQRAS